MTGVIRAFAFEHNRPEAAAQDYELAKVAYRSACEGFDATDERSLERFHSAADRRRDAFDLDQFYRFGGFRLDP